MVNWGKYTSPMDPMENIKHLGYLLPSLPKTPTLRQLSRPPPWFFRAAPSRATRPAVRTLFPAWNNSEKKRVIFGRSKLERPKFGAHIISLALVKGNRQEKTGEKIRPPTPTLHFKGPIPWIYNTYRLLALFLYPSSKGNSIDPTWSRLRVTQLNW